MKQSHVLWAASLTAFLWIAMQPVANATTLFTFGGGEPNIEADGANINIGNYFLVGGSTMYATNIGAYVGLPDVGSGPIDQAGGKTTVAFEANLYSFSLITDSNTLISSTPVPIGTAVNSQGFAYVPYTGTLTPGAVYLLTDVAVDSSGNAIAATPFAYDKNDMSAGTWADATFLLNGFIFAPTPADEAPPFGPDNVNATLQEFLGGNLQFNTPEPSSFVALIGLGAAGLLMAIRRRRAA